MNALDRIEKRELRNLLGKGWLTHDAMWFFHCVQELGIDRTNAINAAAVDSMAVFEVKRMRRALGYPVEGPMSVEEAVRFVREALDILLTDSMPYEFEFEPPATIRWAWPEDGCFAYKGVMRIGVADRYECGVMRRIFAWLSCLGLSYEVDPPVEGCLMVRKGRCAGTLRITS